MQENYQTLVYDASTAIFSIPFPDELKLSDVEEEVERIWKKEKALRGDFLFDGEIFTITERGKNQYRGYFTSYRYLLAQRREPGLYSHLKIHPTCVSGICRAGNYYLIGKRSDQVSQQPGYYEFPPSGGVEPFCQQFGLIDLTKQFKREFNEEIGLNEGSILSITPLASIYDLNEHAYEFCAIIDLQPSCLEVILKPTHEYNELIWIEKKELVAWFQKKKVIPLSQFLLGYLDLD